MQSSPSTGVGDAKVVIQCKKCSRRLRVPTDCGKIIVTCPTCHAQWEWTPDRPRFLHFENVPKYLDAEFFKLYVSKEAIDRSVRSVEGSRTKGPEKPQIGLTDYLAKLDQIAQVGEAASEVHNIVLYGEMIAGPPSNASAEDLAWWKGVDALSRRMTPAIALAAAIDFKRLIDPFEANLDPARLDKLVMAYTHTQGALLGIATNYAMFRFGLLQADYSSPLLPERAEEYLGELESLLELMDETNSAFASDEVFYKQGIRDRIIVEEQALRVRRALASPSS